MRLARRVVIALAVLVAIGLGGGYLYLLRSLPQTRGTIRVAGSSGTIDIVRDADAVPHIFASTKLDALYGLGFVHAQDRLWQMEFQRRVGHGRLSEILGSATLKEDRFLRTVGFGRAAKSAWDRLPPGERAQIDAYVNGVNAFLATHTGSRLPPEFTILGITPEPWSGPDVLAWVKMMAWDLSSNYALELIRRDIATRVGPERMWELFPPYPADGLNIIPDSAVPSPASTSGTVLAGLPAPDARSVSYAEAFAKTLESPLSPLGRLLSGGGGATEGLGSNNWVVDGTLTASGKPLLANDPHLAAQAPSLWYLAHMTAGDFDVAGATLPGTPAVAIGRNRFIAWGETNLFADVQDLYRERLDPSGRNAEFKGVLEPLQLLTEIVKVKGEPDVRVDVRISRHGPLVSDAINANNGVAEGAAEAVEPLAFRWTALDEEDGTVVAFLRVADARNWNEFTTALRSFVTPSQNFVYADVEGHIGYYAPGRIPIRAKGDGRFPAEGWTGDMEWTGWIPFDDLPHSYDPPSHFIVTANNRPVSSGYRYWLSSEYHQPYRAQRIVDLLEARKQLTPDDFRRIQSDRYPLHAQTILPTLLARAHPETDLDLAAVEILRRWDFNARADSRAAAIFEAWFLQLAPALVGEELGPVVTRSYERYFSFITRFVMHALQGTSSFCATEQATDRPSCDDIVTSALHEGVAALAGEMGQNIDGWRWDTVHRAVFDHQVFGTVPVLSWFFNRTIGNQGDWSSVNVGAVAVAAPFEQHEIPGYRQIVDLSSANDNRFLASLGQSGHFLSTHYDDQLQRWRNVRHLPMRLTRKEIERGAIGMLRLVPAIDRQPSLAGTFNRIYAEGTWGRDTTGTGTSGTGSTLEITREYRAFVEDFLEKHAVTSVVDAGSGDWSYSSAIDWGNASYLGVDIASDVISSVRKKHETGRIKFQVGDITEDLPSADLLISKDVFQHLSNELVHKFVRNNLTKGKYKWAILTNDRSGPRQNLDIQPGGHRPLDLAAPPFGVKGLVDLPITFGVETAKLSSLLNLTAIP